MDADDCARIVEGVAAVLDLLAAGAITFSFIAWASPSTIPP